MTFRALRICHEHRLATRLADYIITLPDTFYTEGTPTDPDFISKILHLQAPDGDFLHSFSLGLHRMRVSWLHSIHELLCMLKALRIGPPFHQPVTSRVGLVLVGAQCPSLPKVLLFRSTGLVKPQALHIATPNLSVFVGIQAVEIL